MAIIETEHAQAERAERIDRLTEQAIAAGFDKKQDGFELRLSAAKSLEPMTVIGKLAMAAFFGANGFLVIILTITILRAAGLALYALSFHVPVTLADVAFIAKRLVGDALTWSSVSVAPCIVFLVWLGVFEIVRDRARKLRVRG